MTVIDDVLALIEGDAAVRELCLGPCATAVSSRRLGVAFLHVEGRCGEGLRSEPPGLDRSSARALCELARSREPEQASLGVAAINSLPMPDEHRLRPGNARELILEHGQGKDVALVGHFAFVDELRPRVRNLHVLELQPEQGDLPASKAPEIIPRCDVVGITGSSIVNHTVDELLALARGRYTVILGASTCFSPVLFDHGVDAVCGAVVRDPVAVLADVRAGQSFRHHTGLQKVIQQRA